MSISIIYKQIGKDKMYKTWHSHSDEVMLLYTYTDNGYIVSHNSVVPLKKGTLCFIPNNVSHYTLPDNPNEYIRTKIFISLKQLKTLLPLCSDNGFSAIFNSNKVISVDIPLNNQPLIEDIVSDANNNKNEQIILLSCSLRLFALIKEFTTDIHVKQTSDNITKAIAFINDNIYDNISIEDISNASFLSKFHFCRKFKETIGVTVMEYVLLTKISLAKQLLIDTKKSISEISENLNFSSISYFSSVFKKITGKSPLSYRQSTFKDN
jgi:AraC-like DNA-binding protein